ncbi:cyclase family protein [Leucobacter triazinivorans]|uniref:Cyclase family protein n=1 Tax=Leucobacter triazinivorans TaxID=1784719 RepID=A0A4P6KDZ1_9MICO|nr:cyclase family protein [Leucobacter triazinivorans]QBE48403.1 cyclase family protein [Leucobacter triazinivorans]
MIDLSHPIVSGMTVYPGDPGVRVDPALTVSADGVAVARLALGSHTGTHVDAPAHTIPGGRTVDAFDLDELCGEALILDVSDRAVDGTRIDATALELDGLAEAPPIVVIRTGWDRHFDAPRYLRHPYLDVAAADRLQRLGMRVLAIDTLSPDRTPAAHETADFAVHAVVLGAGGAIVENLRGVEQLEPLGSRVWLGIFPLPLAGADGAPARVVAGPLGAGGASSEHAV